MPPIPFGATLRLIRADWARFHSAAEEVRLVLERNRGAFTSASEHARQAIEDNQEAILSAAEGARRALDLNRTLVHSVAEHVLGTVERNASLMALVGEQTREAAGRYRAHFEAAGLQVNKLIQSLDTAHWPSRSLP